MQVNLKQQTKMSNTTNNFHIVTGGPGSGKTSLIEALRQRGYTCPPEAGRGIIQDQVRIEGNALPWKDQLLFAELMLSWDMRSYHAAEECAGSVFFDRGIPDVLGYLRLVGITAPQHVHNAAVAFRYNPKVFVTPPWPEIYCQDVERKQDIAEAVRTYEALVATYADLNYQLVEIPRCTVSERVSFVLEETKA
jgi:predicted ATPase